MKTRRTGPMPRHGLPPLKMHISTRWVQVPVEIPRGRPLIVLIYARYSTEEQRRRSIKAQIKFCKKFLKALGIKECKIVVRHDAGMSGELKSRPGIDAVRAGIEARDYDLILVEDSSRLYRDDVNCLELVRLIDVQATAAIQNGGWRNFTWTNNRASLNVDGSFAAGDSNNSNPVTVDALTGSGLVDGWTNQVMIFTVGIANGSGTFSGRISNVNLTKTGTGVQVLSGSNNNTGTTTLSGGLLSISTSGNLGAAGSSLVFNGGGLQVTGTSLASLAALGRTVTFTSGQPVTLDINNPANTFTVGQVLNQGAGALVKAGSGTLVLTQSNTYTGATTVAAGNLYLNGTSGATAISVSAGATLGGSGLAASATATVAPAGILEAGYLGAGSLTLKSLTLSGSNTVNIANVGNYLSGAAVSVTGSNLLTFSGASSSTTINLSGLAPGGTGTAHLFSYVGALQGTGYSALTLSTTGLSSPRAASYSLTNANAGYIDLNYSVDYPVWSGGGDGNWITSGGTTVSGATNWNLYSSPSTPTNFLSGDRTDFSDSATGTTTVAINGGDVAPSSVTFSNAAKTYTLSGSNGITGGVSLTKTGSGLLTIGTPNSYTGVTTLGGGTLSVASLADGGANSAIGKSSSAAANLVFNGGALQYTGGGAASNRLFTIGAGGATLDASGSGPLTLTNSGALAGAGPVTLTGANTGNNTLSAAIGGASSVTKNGGGAWVLTASNAYTGTTTVNGGTLSVGSGGSGASIGSTSGVSLLNNANITFNHSDAVTWSKGITGTGAFTKLGGGAMTISASQNYTGATLISGGTLKLTAGSPIPTSGLLRHYTFDGVSTDVSGNNGMGTLTNSASLGTSGAKYGSGYLDLSANGNAVLSIGTSSSNGPTISNSYTLTCWYQNSTDTVFRTLWRGGAGSGGDGDHQIIVNNGTDNLGIWGNGSGGSFAQAGTATIPGLHAADNTWHFMAVVDNGGSLSFYTNNGSVLSLLGTLSKTMQNNQWLTALGNYQTGGQRFAQKVDDAYVYNVALGTTDLTAIMNNSSGGGSNLLPVGTALSIGSGSTLDLGGASQQVASLSGSGLLTTSSTTSPAAFTVGDSSSTAFYGSITDSFASGGTAGMLSLTKVGTGTLALAGTNSSYAGTTTVSNGTLAFASIANAGSNSSLGASSGTSATITLGNSSTSGYLQFIGSSGTSNRTIKLGNDGTIDASGSAPLVLTGGTAVNASGGLNLILAGTGQGVISGGIVGSSPMIKNGPGTWTLSGSSSFGPWLNVSATVNAGTLVVNNAMNLGGGTMQVNGGVLAGTGTASGSVTIGAGGTVAPGNSIGTLTVGGNLVLGGTSDFQIDVTSLISDRIVGINNLTYGGTLKITNSTGSFAAGQGWDLFDFTGGTSGLFANNGDFGVPGGGGSLPSLAGNLGWLFDYSSGSLSIAAVATGNNSKLWVGGTEPTLSGGTTSVSQAFGRVMLSTSPTASVALNSNGGDAATTNASITIGGDALTTTSSGFISALTASGINVGLNTGTPGDKSGTVVLQNSATSSAATSQGSDNGAATILVSGTVVDKRVVTASAIDLGVLHTGTVLNGSNSGTTTLSSTGANNLFTTVEVAGTTFNGTITSGMTNVGAAGGVVATSGTLNTLSVIKLENLAGEGTYAPVAVPYTATVFSGTGVWALTSGTSGAWGTKASAHWSGGAAPGTFGSPYNDTDTAAFDGTGSVLSVSLTGANPSLAALTFSGSNYTLSDGTLTLALSGTGSPTISVTDATSQTISSTIAGTQGLLKDGPGTLILSGSNTFTGGATVTDGTLALSSASALVDGSSLTVGAGATFLFDPAATAHAPVALAGNTANAAPISPVPEPGTLGLLLAAGVATAAAWRRRKRG